MLPPTGIFFIPQVIYEYRELRRNNIDGEKIEEIGESLSHYLFVHHKSHMDSPWRDPGSLR
jgi:hypothetical protein